MAKAFGTWKVLHHSPFEKLADNLWRVQGELPGMSLERVMTVVRLHDGRLVIHSAIALAPPQLAELEAWGTPAFLVIPNGWHRLDAAAYVQRYPQLQVFAPSGSRDKVTEVVPVAGTYSDFPPDDTVQLEPLRGVKNLEGVMRVRSADGVSLLLGDVVMNMDRKRDILGFLFTTLMGSAPGPRMSRIVRYFMADDRAALRADLHRLAATPELVRDRGARESRQRPERGSSAAPGSHLHLKHARPQASAE